MEEKNTKKKNIILSMLFSLVCVFLVTIPTLTFAWFKQYMNVTSKTITITSGESVAYIEIEIYTYQNKTINEPFEGNPFLGFHTSLDYDHDFNCTSNADGSGVVNVSFENITVSQADLTQGYGGLNNPDFFKGFCITAIITSSNKSLACSTIFICPFVIGSKLPGYKTFVIMISPTF